jgi:hypothetical protein
MVSNDPLVGRIRCVNIYPVSSDDICVNKMNTI